jgi:hypothetical protein
MTRWQDDDEIERARQNDPVPRSWGELFTVRRRVTHVQPSSPPWVNLVSGIILVPLFLAAPVIKNASPRVIEIYGMVAFAGFVIVLVLNVLYSWSRKR